MTEKFEPLINKSEAFQNYIGTYPKVEDLFHRKRLLSAFNWYLKYATMWQDSYFFDYDDTMKELIVEWEKSEDKKNISIDKRAWFLLWLFKKAFHDLRGDKK